jgi:hypothetical protein
MVNSFIGKVLNQFNPELAFKAKRNVVVNKVVEQVLFNYAQQFGIEAIGRNNSGLVVESIVDLQGSAKIFADHFSQTRNFTDNPIKLLWPNTETMEYIMANLPLAQAETRAAIEAIPQFRGNKQELWNKIQITELRL